MCCEIMRSDPCEPPCDKHAPIKQIKVWCDTLPKITKEIRMIMNQMIEGT